MLRSAVLLVSATLRVCGAAYTDNPGYNCYGGHGATDMESPSGSASPGSPMSVSACESLCDGTDGCEGVTVAQGSGAVNCYRRKGIVLSQCQTNDVYDTYVKSSGPAPPPAPGGLCAELAGTQCYGDDIRDAGAVASAAACCAACEQAAGCGAWTFNGGSGDAHCWVKHGCTDRRSGQGYVSGIGPPAPTTPTPPAPPTPPPAPVGPSDFKFTWTATDAHGACSGPVFIDPPAVVSNGMDITLRGDDSSSGACVYRTASAPINLREYTRIEADVTTSGNVDVTGKGTHSGQWFSFWMYPHGYAYSTGDAQSGEIDMIENYNSVATNFAGCSHSGLASHCTEKGWGVPTNKVSGHVTMRFDNSTARVQVQHCAHGSATCEGGDAAWIDLPYFAVNTVGHSTPTYEYRLCADIWYAEPGQNFVFSVTGVRVMRT